MISRKLLPWERDVLRFHLLRLGPEERRLRFCRRVDDDAIHAYCDRMDHARTTVIGGFVDGALRGAAELIQIPQMWPPSAEIALSVEGPFQRQGVGGELFSRALLVARNRCIRAVHLTSLNENEPVRRLARMFGATAASLLTTTEWRIVLPWPSHLSLLEEVAFNNQALLGAVIEDSCHEQTSDNGRCSRPRHGTGVRLRAA